MILGVEHFGGERIEAEQRGAEQSGQERKGKESRGEERRGEETTTSFSLENPLNLICQKAHIFRCTSKIIVCLM